MTWQSFTSARHPQQGVFTLETREVSPNIFLIDENLYGVPRSGAVFLINEDRKALIDSGPTTSSQTILAGIAKIGVQPEEIDYIILTHIHLDHSGGAGTLLKYMPRAKVLAHQRAIRHLIDPSRLIISATQAQGDDSPTRNGEVLPIAENRLVAVHDGDTLKLSAQQTLTLLDCPGHAPHELCIYESRSRGIFVGDAVGHTVEGTDIIVPITPPPSFNLELYLQTLDRLKKLKASKLYFSHFGVSAAVEEKLEAAANELRARDAIIAEAFGENRPEVAAERVINHIRAGLAGIKERDGLLHDYWLEHDAKMSAGEHVRYFASKLKLV
jgi:glyoxylase-like metal-dependent hydrolase (beta-lactamase superfamily II)